MLDAASVSSVSALFLRSIHVLWVFATIPFAIVLRELTAEAPPTHEERLGWWGELLARALERLGATYVKLGQILGSRPDLLHPAIFREMARLQDDVEPLSFDVVDRVLTESWGARRAELDVDPEPIAAASVAQVHRGTLRSGERVAIKVQRPEARPQIERDLVLMRWVAGWLDRIPSVHLFSLPGALERFGTALHDQLDFRLEAANNLRFAHNFRRERKVRVPALHPELSDDRVLVMEFVEGVKATSPEAFGSELSEDERRAARSALAARGGRAILKMVFEDGFVHADLHPGNILFTSDGTMVFLDVGMVASIEPDLMRPWVDTFSALAQRDGARAAELFYGYAPTAAVEDYGAYVRDVTAYLDGVYGASTLAEIEVGAVVSGMMNVLRVHRVQVDPVFTVVHVALLVAEGLGKQLDPKIDLILLAVPFLLAAQLGAPPGRPPRRPTPRLRGDLEA